MFQKNIVLSQERIMCRFVQTVTQNEMDYPGYRWEEEEGRRVRTRRRKKKTRQYQITSTTINPLLRF
jgi:hypothetical protein